MSEVTKALKLFKDMLEAGWHLAAMLFVSTLVLGLFVPILRDPWINMALWGALQIGVLVGLVRLTLRALPPAAEGNRIARWDRFKQATWEVFELGGGLFAIAIAAVCLHEVQSRPTHEHSDLLLFGGIGLFGVWMVLSAIRQYLRHLRHVAGGQGAEP